MPKNKKLGKSLPKVKKEINDFLLSEEGKINKRNIAKIGISLAVLGLMLEPQSASASHTSHNSHNSALFSSGRGGHNSSTPHTNSHSSHGSGGWC